MSTNISPIVTGTTHKFQVQITYQGSNPNITADVVTFTLKSKRSDPDSEALLIKDADVTTSGATGIALFTLTPTETEITPGQYPYDIIWYPTSGEEHSLRVDKVEITARVSDP